MRCDCNVSVRKVGIEKFGTKVEIKNINSFRFVEKAIEYEIDRQIDEVEGGKLIIQETRLYDPDKNRTFSMRLKEDAQDYRYFPDPDLLPIIVTDAQIEIIRKTIPELPQARALRFQNQLGLPQADALVLTDEIQVADYFEAVNKVSQNAKASANWVMGEILREINATKLKIKESPITPIQLGELIKLIDQGVISGKIAKVVFLEMWKTGNEPQKIISEKGLGQVSDTGAIEKMVDDVLAASPSQVAEYRAGKTKVFGFLVGSVLKISKGQANPDIVNDLLKKKLEQS